MKTENIEYKQGDTTFEGYLVYDDADVTPPPRHSRLSRMVGTQ